MIDYFKVNQQSIMDHQQISARTDIADVYYFPVLFFKTTENVKLLEISGKKFHYLSQAV